MIVKIGFIIQFICIAIVFGWFIFGLTQDEK